MPVDWSALGSAVPDLATLVNARTAEVAQANTQQQMDQRAAKAKADAAQAAVEQQAQADASAAWANGDTRGAQAAYMRSGQNGLLTSVNTADAQAFGQHEKGLQAIGGFAQYVMTHITDPAQRAAVIRHNAPLLQAGGAHADDIETVASDPSDAVLGGIAHQYYSAKDQDATANQVQQTAINQQNANTQQAAEIRAEQTPVGISTQDNVYLPGGTNGGLVGGTAPAGAPAQGTVAQRNNNAGNLRWDGHSRWQGMTGVDPNGFVIFDTPANGARAMDINIANAGKLHGINTVGGLISRWAPASDNNNTAAYAAQVAQALGVGVNDTINLADPAVRQKIAGVIARVEGAGTPASPQDSAQNNPQGIRGPTMLSAGVPKRDPNDVDQNDPAIEQGARHYIVTGELPALGNGNGGIRHAMLTRAAQIVQENHWGPAQVAANKADYKASTAALAQDQKQFDTISGSERTALANGQRFIDLSASMPGNTGWQTYNRARNGLGAEFGDTRVTNANAAYQTFVTEYARVVSSTPNGAGQLTDAARHEAQDTLQNSASIEQKRKAFEVLKADMKARTDALQGNIDARRGHIESLGGSNSQAPQPNRPAVPAKAAGFLRANPNLRADFDRKYGAGASASVLGN